MPDEVIKCTDCRMDFTFTEGEQNFFAEKSLVAPRRCKICRQKRRDLKSVAAPPEEQPSSNAGRWTNGTTGTPESVKPRRNDGGSRKSRRKGDTSYGD